MTLSAVAAAQYLQNLTVDKSVATIHAASVNNRKAQQNQLLKLNQKAEEDYALLDAMRSFLRQRAEIEQDYAQKLDRISKQFAQTWGSSSAGAGKRGRRISVSRPVSIAGSVSTATGADYGDDSKSTTTRLSQIAFQALLTETEKQARYRSTIQEKIGTDIVDVLRDYQKERTILSKKYTDVGTRLQQELWNAYADLGKAKKIYNDFEVELESAKAKYDEVVKNKGFTLTSMKNMLRGRDKDQAVEKARKKVKDLTSKVEGARNEYILAIEAVNSHQTHYYNEEVPNLMRYFDGTFYDVIRAALTKYATMEADYAAANNDCARTINESAMRMDRDQDASSFILDYKPMFRSAANFSFERVGADTVDSLTVDNVTKIVLGNKLATITQDLSRIDHEIQLKRKEVAAISQLAQTYSTNPDMGKAMDPLEEKTEYEFKIESLLMQRFKLNAQANLLSSVGIEATHATGSLGSLAVLSRPGNTGGLSRPKVLVQYDYTAQNDQELTIKQDQVVIVLEDDDGNGWMKGELNGQQGLFPASYVVPHSDTKNEAMAQYNLGPNEVLALYDYVAKEDGDISFKAGEVIEVLDRSGDFWEGRTKDGKTGYFPVVLVHSNSNMSSSPSKSGGTLSRTASMNAKENGKRDGSVNSLKNLVASMQNPPQNTTPQTEKVKAKISYTATVEGELSIEVGDIIEVTNKDTGSDSWWEGRCNGKVGLFPKPYVEEIINVISIPVPSNVSGGTISRGASKHETAPAEEKVRALYPYTAQADGELTFKPGDVIVVVNKVVPDDSSGEWWEGKMGGSVGYFPKSYVESV